MIVSFYSFIRWMCLLLIISAVAGCGNSSTNKMVTSFTNSPYIYGAYVIGGPKFDKARSATYITIADLSSNKPAWRPILIVPSIKFPQIHLKILVVNNSILLFDSKFIHQFNIKMNSYSSMKWGKQARTENAIFTGGTVVKNNTVYFLLNGMNPANIHETEPDVWLARYQIDSNHLNYTKLPFSDVPPGQGVISLGPDNHLLVIQNSILWILTTKGQVVRKIAVPDYTQVDYLPQYGVLLSGFYPGEKQSHKIMVLYDHFNKRKYITKGISAIWAYNRHIVVEKNSSTLQLLTLNNHYDVTKKVKLFTVSGGHLTSSLYLNKSRKFLAFQYFVKGFWPWSSDDFGSVFINLKTHKFVKIKNDSMRTIIWNSHKIKLNTKKKWRKEKDKN